PITAILRAIADYRSAVLRRLLLVVLALALAATAAASPRKTEQQLGLVAFPGYAEAGGDDPRVNWVGAFVQQTGCKVRVRTARARRLGGALRPPLRREGRAVRRRGLARAGCRSTGDPHAVRARPRAVPPSGAGRRGPVRGRRLLLARPDERARRLHRWERR